jgi:hypothetical protein
MSRDDRTSCSTSCIFEKQAMDIDPDVECDQTSARILESASQDPDRADLDGNMFFWIASF